MKLQKIILCVAVALAACGASLGLLEIGNYLRTAFEPVRTDVKLKPVPAPTVFYQPPLIELKQPVGVGEAEGDQEFCDYGETGDYQIFGENPKGFEEIQYLTVITKEYDEQKREILPVKPYGSVKTGREFKFTWINITGKRISFVTQTKRGVSYQFDGRFVDEEAVQKDGNGEEIPHQILLKGRLLKMRNGKKAAEAKVKLEEMCGC